MSEAWRNESGGIATGEHLISFLLGGYDEAHFEILSSCELRTSPWPVSSTH
jgi:hypothetical protein